MNKNVDTYLLENFRMTSFFAGRSVYMAFILRAMTTNRKPIFNTKNISMLQL